MRRKFLGLLFVLMLTFVVTGCSLGEIDVPVNVVTNAPVDLDEVYINVVSQIPNKDAITGDITLPTKFGSVVVVWSSNNPNLIDAQGHVHRPEVDTQVTLTCILSDGKNQKTYQLSLTVKAEEIVVSVIEPISDILRADAETNHKAKGVVYALSNVSFVLKDSSGMILVYLDIDYRNDLAVGDEVEVEGATSLYGGNLQFNRPAYSKVGTKSVSHGTPVELDVAKYEALANGAPIQYVKFQTRIVKSGKYYNLTFSGSNIAGSLASPIIANIDDYLGKDVNVTGYFIYVTASAAGTKYIYFIATDIEEVGGGQVDPPTPPEPPVVEEKTIAQILSGAVGDTYKTKATVIATSSVSFLLKDSTGMILAYVGDNYAKDLAVGDVVLVEAMTSTYNGTIQLGTTSAAPVYSKVETASVSYPTPRELSGADIDALVAQTAPALEYVTIKGVLTISGKYLNVTIDGTTVKGSLATDKDLTALHGKAIIATGYYLYSTSRGAYANIIVTSVEEDTSAVITPVDASTIAQVLEGTVGSTYKVEDATIVALCSRGMVLADNTGLIFAYVASGFKYDSFSIGQKVTVEGSSSLYNKRVQFNSPSITAGENGFYTQPEPIVLDGPALEAKVSGELIDCALVQVTGKAAFGNYANVIVEGTNIQAAIAYPYQDLSEFNEKDVVVTGYLVYLSSGKYAYLVLVDIEEVQVAPKTDEELLAEAVERLAQWNTGSVMHPILPTEFDDLGVNLSWKLVVDVPMEEDGSWWPYKYSDEEAVFDVTLTKGELSEVVEIRFVMKALSTTSDLQAMSSDELDADYFAVQGIVVAVYNNGFLVNDGQGYILTYLGNNYNKDLKVGDVIVERGVVNKYRGFSQFSSFVGYKVLDEREVTAQYLAADGEMITAALDNPMILPVEVKGQLIQSGNYLNLNIEGTDIIGSVLTSEDLSDYVDKYVILRGYFVYFSSNSANTFANLILSDIEIDENAQPVVLELSTIEEAIAGTEGDKYLIEGMVVGTSSVGFIVQDETGLIEIYYGNNNYPRVQYGNIVKVQGTLSIYGGVAELINSSFEITGNEQFVVPEVNDEDFLDAEGVNALANADKVQYISVTGVLTVNGNYINLKVDGANVIISIVKPNSSVLEEYNGMNMIITGYFINTSVSGDKVYANIMCLLFGPDIEEAENIAEIVASEPGTFSVYGTVVATSEAGFLLMDDSGYIFCYNPNGTDGYDIGSVLNVVGKTALYGGRIQFSSPDYYYQSSTTVDYPEAREIDGAAFDALALAENVNIEYVTFTAMLQKSGNYYNFFIEGANIIGGLSTPSISFFQFGAVGNKVKFTGYYIYTTESKDGQKYGYIIFTDFVVVEGVTYNVTINIDDTEHASVENNQLELVPGFNNIVITLAEGYAVKSATCLYKDAGMVIDGGNTLIFYLAQDEEINVEIANIKNQSYKVYVGEEPQEGHTLLMYGWTHDLENDTRPNETVVATFSDGVISATFNNIAPIGVVIAELKDGETELGEEWVNVLRQSIDLNPLKNESVTWKDHGTIDNPITVSQAYRQGEALKNYAGDFDFYVKGRVVEIVKDVEFGRINGITLEDNNGDRMIVRYPLDRFGFRSLFDYDCPIDIDDEIVILTNIYKTDIGEFFVPTLDIAKVLSVNGVDTVFELTFDGGVEYYDYIKENSVFYVVGYYVEDDTTKAAIEKAELGYGRLVAKFNVPATQFMVLGYLLEEGQTEPESFNDYYVKSERLRDIYSQVVLHLADEITFDNDIAHNEDGTKTLTLDFILSPEMIDPQFEVVDLIVCGCLNGDFDAEYKEESLIASDKSNMTVTYDEATRHYSIKVVVSAEVFNEYANVYYYGAPNKGALAVDILINIMDGEMDLTPKFQYNYTGYYGTYGFFTSYVDVVEGVEHKGTIDDPLTANEALLIAEYLPEGVYTLDEFYIEGAVKGVNNRDYFYDYYLDCGELVAGYLVWGMSTADEQYRYGTMFNQVESAGFEEGDVIVVCGIIEHYVNDSGNSVLRTPIAKLIKVNGEEATYTVISE